MKIVECRLKRFLCFHVRNEKKKVENFNCKFLNECGIFFRGLTIFMLNLEGFLEIKFMDKFSGYLHNDIKLMLCGLLEAELNPN